MKYESTRSDYTIPASQAILKGLAPDGGLFVPTALQLFPLHDMVNATYQDIACWCLHTYYPDLSATGLQQAVQEAYSGINFHHPKISGLQQTLDNRFYLELFHGKTLAFKDHALVLFPYLVNLAKQTNNFTDDLYILSATSGDTGKAAMEAIADQPGISIQVLYPEEGVSDLQKRQMQTQQGDNIQVYAIKGNFDDAQRSVKAMFASSSFNKTLNRHHMQLSSANSINIARLIPQTVYYFDVYLRLVRNGVIALGDSINVCVPTGNFGNILAAYLAKEMGLPIKQLICATNENKVLDDFIKTGVFSLVERPFHQTHSPSMDIMIPSNLERFLYFLFKDKNLIVQWMDQLAKKKRFCLTPEQLQQLQSHITSASCDNQETLNSIAACYQNEHYLIDPHTAVARHALLTQLDNDYASVIVSTANPYKFSECYQEIFNLDAADPFARMDQLARLSNTSVPEVMESYQQASIRFNRVIDKEEVQTVLEDALEDKQ